MNKYTAKEASKIHRAHRNKTGPSAQLKTLERSRLFGTFVEYGPQYQTGPRHGQQLSLARKRVIA